MNMQIIINKILAVWTAKRGVQIIASYHYKMGQNDRLKCYVMSHVIKSSQYICIFSPLLEKKYAPVCSNSPYIITFLFFCFCQNRDGKVTRKEFRQIVERFTFRLDDQQFKELMKHVGPTQNNRVSYHEFLNLFEEKESLKVKTLTMLWLLKSDFIIMIVSFLLR